MRKFILPAILAVSVGLTGAAFASTTTMGTIKSIDTKAMSVTLDNGQVYLLPPGFKLNTLKVGEKVSVIWTEKNGKYEASAVTAAS
ncbi:MAG: DUF1344 domain-containing protein [Rhodobacteraceae bacterium]|nr:DUF1344 domain-containing protein [Paracoccaceae bacterium]